MAARGYGRAATGSDRWGIARTYALVFGLAYLAIALLEVVVGNDGWRMGNQLLLKLVQPQNLIHWAVGAIVLGSFFAGEAAAKMIARVIGVVFAVLTIWGFVARDSLGDLLGFPRPLPWSYNVVHLLTALLALFAGFAATRAYGRR